MKQRPPPPIRGQPLIHTLNMEQMHARQTPHRLALAELAQANRALLARLRRRRAAPIPVRQRVRLDGLLAGAPVQTEQTLLEAHNVLQTPVQEVDARVVGAHGRGQSRLRSEGVARRQRLVADEDAAAARHVNEVGAGVTGA